MNPMIQPKQTTILRSVLQSRGGRPREQLRTLNVERFESFGGGEVMPVKQDTIRDGNAGDNNDTQ